MFKISSELMKKIQQAITPKQLAPATGVFAAGCFGCSGTCSGNCKGSCFNSCLTGCGTTCAGKNK